MIFFSYGELKKAIEGDAKKGAELHPSDLKVLFSKKIGEAGNFSIKDRKISTQELFFLLDQYEIEENRVFSDWILTDQTLIAFLYDLELPKHFEVKKHKGHFLEEKYFLFVAQFLFPKLDAALTQGIKNQDGHQLIRLAELMQILPKKDKDELQRKLSIYLDSIIKGSKNNESEAKDNLLQLETVVLLNSLGESYYAMKVSFLGAVKTLINEDPELSLRATRVLKKLKLHDAHKKEVEVFLSKLTNTKQKRGAAIPHFLRTPLFYIGVLILAVLIYVLVPKEVVRPTQSSGLPKNRTGLDSLSLDEVKSADSLLGFKGDSVIVDNEEFKTVPLVDQYQMIDSDDTLKNELARALSISMAADYKIQKDQNDSQDCEPMRMGDKNRFQMKGVQNLDNIKGGFNHRIDNKSPYDLYILIFENIQGGKVYGSFIPSKGELKLELQERMRMIIYSGKDLTKFNPLRHKNGGYGSIVYAKRIDERFVAHFCTLNEYNLQLMSKSWSATKKGRKTTVSSNGGPIKFTSDAFME